MASTSEGAFCFRTAAHGYKRTALGRERDAVDGSVADLVEELARRPALVGWRGVGAARDQRCRQRGRGGAPALRLEEGLGARRRSLLRRQAQREGRDLTAEEEQGQRGAARRRARHSWQVYNRSVTAVVARAACTACLLTIWHKLIL